MGNTVRIDRIVRYNGLVGIANVDSLHTWYVEFEDGSGGWFETQELDFVFSNYVE